MVTKPLPTGDETPEGFEQFYEDMRNSTLGIETTRVSRVAATQLSHSEIHALERLRNKAVEALGDFKNARGFEMTFDREMNLWPEGKSPTDKLVFRDFKEGTLRGYALVVRGWPSADTWTIQHLIIDPDCRLQGIGKRIIDSIELDALSTTETTDKIVAVPVAESNDSFWKFNGYECAGMHSTELLGKTFSFEVFQKNIR